jgi:hypothetical protein
MTEVTGQHVTIGNEFSTGLLPAYRKDFIIMEPDNFEHCHHLVTSSGIAEEQTLAQNPGTEKR